MALTKVTPFVGTDTAGRALEDAHRKMPTYRAYFSDGSRWTFTSSDPIAAQGDARFWADFTRRELVAVAGL